MNFITKYLDQVKKIIDQIDKEQIKKMIQLIVETRNKEGRVFLLGVGGSAANCSHAVNDFRKLVNIEAYTPVDNVSELTARTNDEGWETVFIEWLRLSKLNNNDLILIFSVGGGNVEKNVSVNLIKAMDFAKSLGTKIGSIVGRDGGYAAKVSDVSVIIPVVDMDLVTPHSEEFQAIVWHLIVSHPKLQFNKTKW